MYTILEALKIFYDLKNILNTFFFTKLKKKIKNSSKSRPLLSYIYTFIQLYTNIFLYK